ncbi:MULTISPECIES: hypothetical protein [Trichocoleus]|uniref:Uncharacterized protein n=1 Tax=Trichocoleus desertorum GB2-A4 TaxID=2933944 RepID=A0ABV0JCN4_9CYAN|nr:hypothetical protein [Trichocoleus sp. FACHB-46]MBD1864197.1 hypothetical protein [Trichocoleus sp. FACHB-46]
MTPEQINRQMQRCETLHEIKQLLEQLHLSGLSAATECGVISIKNLVTGDRLIGGTPFPEEALRIIQDQLSTQNHPDTALQQAWIELVAEQFVLEVLEHCHLDLLEQRLTYWRTLFQARTFDCTPKHGKNQP